MLFLSRGLVRRPLRTTLTVLGVALGVASYAVIAAAASGIVDRFEGLVSAVNCELLVHQGGVDVPILSRVPETQIAALGRWRSIRAVSGVIAQRTRLRDNTPMLVIAVRPDAPFMNVVTVERGSTFGATDWEAMLGVGAARRLGLGPGDEVELLRRQKVSVSGVFSTGYGLVDNAILLPLEPAQRLFGLEGLVNLAFVKLAEGTDVPAAADGIEKAFPGLQADVWELYIGGLHELTLVRTFARFLSIVGLVIAALVAAVSLTMNVSERGLELAILRAVGWSRWRTAAAVLIDALALTGTGGVLGLTVAVLFLRLLAAQDTLGYFPTSIPPATLAASCGMILLAGIAGAAPALARALRVEPAQLLRAG